GADARSALAVVARFAPGRSVTTTTRIDERGLSSLERVELMMALEEALQITVDESRFAAAATVGDFEAMARPLEGVSGAASTTGVVEPIDFPTWNRTAPARALRRVSLPTWILPLARVFATIKVEGLEHLDALDGP